MGSKCPDSRKSEACKAQGGNLQKRLIGFVIAAMSAQVAALDIGLDYLSGETQVFDLQGNRNSFDLSGVGYSLGANLTDTVSVRLSSSNRDGRQADDLQVLNQTLAVDQQAELSASSLSVSWQFDDFWLGARYSVQDDSSQIVGSTQGRRPNRTLALDISETSESQTLSVEAGRDWFLGSWAMGLSGSFASTDSEFSRVERVDSLNLSQVQTLQQSLDGTDLSVTLSMSHLSETDRGALLVPAVSLFHRVQIDGVVAGSGSIRTTATGVRGERSASQGFGFDDPLDSADESYLDLAFSLITGPWLGTASYSIPMQGDNGNSFYLGLGYQF